MHSHIHTVAESVYNLVVEHALQTEEVILQFPANQCSNQVVRLSYRDDKNKGD